MPYSLGGFNEDKTGVGTIAEFNLWNYAIPSELIDINTCGAAGSVVSWNTLWEMGTTVKFYERLPGKCGKGRLLTAIIK